MLPRAGGTAGPRAASHRVSFAARSAGCAHGVGQPASNSGRRAPARGSPIARSCGNSYPTRAPARLLHAKAQGLGRPPGASRDRATRGATFAHRHLGFGKATFNVRIPVVRTLVRGDRGRQPCTRATSPPPAAPPTARLARAGELVRFGRKAVVVEDHPDGGGPGNSKRVPPMAETTRIARGGAAGCLATPAEIAIPAQVPRDRHEEARAPPCDEQARLRGGMSKRVYRSSAYIGTSGPVVRRRPTRALAPVAFNNRAVSAANALSRRRYRFLPGSEQRQRFLVRRDLLLGIRCRRCRRRCATRRVLLVLGTFRTER